MPPLDDDPPVATRSGTFLQIVTPGRPATFLGDGCQLVVARDALDFDIALRGSVVTRNQHDVGQVLRVIVAHADAMRLSLGGLLELDGAGAIMLDDAANLAGRLGVEWNVVDGGLRWQGALAQPAPTSTNDPPSDRQRPARIIGSRLHRPRPPILPIT